MNTRHTPRTDAAHAEIHREFPEHASDSYWADFARTLERENAEMREALEAQEKAELARYDWNDHGNQMEEWEANLWFMENKRLKEALDTANTKARDLRKAALSKAAGTEQS